MAVDVSPVILNKIPFDAELEGVLYFTYSGSQIYGYGIIIEESTLQENKYITTITDNSQQNVLREAVAKIPAGTLENGKRYNFSIYVLDHNNKQSPTSQPITLQCLKTPVFTFANVSDQMIVRSSYLDVQISYYQENDELLNAYTIYLYSNEKNLIWSSDTCYADTALVTVPALMDRVTYYLQATGETVNGIEMQTEMIQFNCEYIKPDLFLKFRAENIPEEGAARLSSNFVLVEGKSIPETLVYISDEKVVLLPDQDGEKKVYFDDGYMADNFFCDIVVSDIPDFATIFVSNMKNAMCRITWNWGEFVGYEGIVYYAELVAYSFVGNETLNYIIRSNKIPPLEQGQQVFIWFRHRDGLFDIKIEALPMETQTIEVIEGGDVE